MAQNKCDVAQDALSHAQLQLSKVDFAKLEETASSVAQTEKLSEANMQAHLERLSFDKKTSVLVCLLLNALPSQSLTSQLDAINVQMVLQTCPLLLAWGVLFK